MKNSLVYYQGTGYGIINKTLWDENVNDDFLFKNYKKDDILSHIYNIQKTIKESGRQKSITLFRCITAIDFDIHHTFNEKGFSSCTTDIDIATKNYSNDGWCTLSFILPTNIDAYIYKYKGKYKEDEYILRRNIEYFNL